MPKSILVKSGGGETSVHLSEPEHLFVVSNVPCWDGAAGERRMVPTIQRAPEGYPAGMLIGEAFREAKRRAGWNRELPVGGSRV